MFRGTLGIIHFLLLEFFLPPAMTNSFYIILRVVTCHTPILAEGSANGRLKTLHIFKASELTSVKLFSTAKAAANG